MDFEWSTPVVVRTGFGWTRKPLLYGFPGSDNRRNGYIIRISCPRDNTRCIVRPERRGFQRRRLGYQALPLVIHRYTVIQSLMHLYSGTGVT